MQIPFLDIRQKWYVVNSQRKEQFGPLSTYHLQDYLLRLDTMSLPNTLIRSPNSDKWYNGRDILKVLRVLQIPYEASPSPALEPALKMHVADTASALFTDAIFVVKRKFPRISGKLNVFIISGKICVRTGTRTLSMGGLGLEPAIPREMFLPNSKAVLSIKDSSTPGIVVTLSSVANRHNDNSVRCARFQELRGSAMITYFDWIREMGG